MQRVHASSAFVTAPLWPYKRPLRRRGTVCTLPTDVGGTGVETAVLPRIRALSAATRRGRRATALQATEAEGYAAQLEAVAQPPPLLEPQAALLNGVWTLIYLKSGARRKDSDLQSSTIRAADEEDDRRNVTQTLDLPALRAENAAEFPWLLGIRVRVRVDARLTPLEDNATVEVRFRNVFFKVGPLPELWFPLWIFRPKGTLKTTYLSQECRVGRGDKGSLFILVRNV